MRLSSPGNPAGLRDSGRKARAGGSMYALPRRAPLCRPAAHAALSGLRASGWIDHSTRTVLVHFALYNPPTRLLSSVSLRAELLPAGGLALSPLVESLAVFHNDSALWSSPTLPEVGPPAPFPARGSRGSTCGLLPTSPWTHRDTEPGTRDRRHSVPSVFLWFDKALAQASTAPQRDGAVS